MEDFKEKTQAGIKNNLQGYTHEPICTRFKINKQLPRWTDKILFVKFKKNSGGVVQVLSHNQWPILIPMATLYPNRRSYLDPTKRKRGFYKRHVTQACFLRLETKNSTEFDDQVRSRSQRSRVERV